MTRLKGVLIGTGYFSQFQLDAWQRIPNAKIVAVCDLDQVKAAAMADQFNVAGVYTDFGEMLDREKPDFVDIVTPPQTHFELCQLAAERGVHIICQKPVAPTFNEAAALVEMVNRHEVRLMIHENFRWQPWYREIKRLMIDETLGDVFTFYFQMRTGDGWGEDAYLGRQPFFRNYKKLLMYETGVHFVDTFRYLFGEITAVYANLRQLNPVIQGEDSGQVIFQHACGTTSIFDANRYNESESSDPRYTFGTVRLDASKGHLTMDTDGLFRLKRLGEPIQILDYPKSRVGFGGDCVHRIQSHFVDAFLTGQPFENHGADYLKTMAVVDACYASAEQGRVIQLESPS